jgi:hypothetical protein
MRLLTKTILTDLAAALVFAVPPLTSVSAVGPADVSIPSQNRLSNERLERIWARQLRTYNRLGRADRFIDHLQRLIDHAKANGRDISAVQAALDAFGAAVQDVHPVYEGMKGIVTLHPGFGENGKVTDPVKAQETVKEMHAKIQEIKTAMNGTGSALREAIKAFREANSHLQPAPTPSGA